LKGAVHVKRKKSSLELLAVGVEELAVELVLVFAHVEDEGAGGADLGSI
jgi:hypothetical protein